MSLTMDVDFSRSFDNMQSVPDEKNDSPVHGKPRGQGRREIVINSAWLTLPLTILTAALLIYVFMHEVVFENDTSSVLGHNALVVPNDGSMYVRVDSTMLIFLASWMSSVAPLLTSFAIGLVTFPITSQLLSDTRTPDRAYDLPTSVQLHSMLKIINGATWTGLWSLLDHCPNWKQCTKGRRVALNYLIGVTTGTILLSMVIFAADTWLHMATTTVELVVPRALSTQEALYSFCSLASCTRTNNSFTALNATNTTCTLNPAYDLPVYDDPVSTTLTLSNRSVSTSVLQTSSASGSLSYMGIPPTVQDSSYDFKASTYAAQAICSSTSQACKLANNGNVTFDCNNGAFAAEGSQLADQGGFAMQIFKYSNLSDFEDFQQEYGVPNPFYVAGAAISPLPPDSALHTDNEVVTSGSTVSAVFQCQVTILDLDYTSIRGEINVISEQVSNVSATNMFMSGVTGASFGLNVVNVNMGLAALVANSAQDFADRFGTEVNNVILSSGAGSVMHVPVEVAQVRESILVARVPKTPFYLLVSSNLAFVVLGFFLAIVAMATPADARQAQYQLTTAGLVGHLFDRGNARDPVDAFGQSLAQVHERSSAVKIGIDRTSKGGYELTPLRFAQ